METGPLIAAFNATIARLSAIDKALEANTAERLALVAERTALLNDIERARNVIVHLAPPDAGAVAGAAVIEAERVIRKRRRPIQASSSVGYAREILRTAKAPMHIDNIIAMIDKMHGVRVNRATLVSNLSRYVKANDTFRRTAENTFDLIRDGESKEMRLVG